MSRTRLVAVAAVLSLVAGVSPLLTSAVAAAPGGTVDVIVVLDDAGAPGGHGANKARAGEVARSHGLRPTQTYGTAVFGFAATVPEGRVAALERDPRVAFVEEDGRAYALDYPNGVKRIDADDAHSLTTGAVTGSAIRVAIVDSGIDLDHPDLAGTIGEGTNCISPSSPPDDDNGHGTHVAGTVAANSTRIKGVAPGATVLPVKVLDSGGSGTWSQVICGIDWVAVNNVDVANMSLGGAGSFDGLVCGADDGSLFQALCAAIAAGTTFTVAAGNDSKDASGFVPAAHPDVVTVSAFSDDDGVADSTSCSGFGYWQTCDESFASFSNYGSIVDVTAPGVDIFSTTMGGGTGTKSGTSMAAPHVAGVVALVLEANPAMAPAEVAAHLRATGQCPDTNENPGSGTCAGSWHNDPDGIAEPMANGLFAVQGSSGDDGGSGDNTAPLAGDDLAEVAAGGSVSIDVLANDSDPDGDPDGDPLSVAVASGPTAGTATVNPDNTITYAHNGEATDADSFTYTVTDAHGATATATVSITITSSRTGEITLSASGSKVKGVHTVDLEWSGAVTTSVDVYREGGLVGPTANDGAYTDETGNKGRGSYTYQVCEVETFDTSTCSNPVTVTF